MISRSRLSSIAMPWALPALLSLLGLGVLAGCDDKNDNNLSERRYCDSSGCYACTSDNRCYPVPGDPAKPDPIPNPGPGNGTCDNDASCGAGNLCNLGHCEPGCADDAHCSSGETCVSGRCRPMGAPQCGIAGALCTADAQCGANSKCVNRACATNCTANECALGQVCSAGSCIEDPSPASPQCQYDLDCGAGKGGFRCVNAYCLPTCKVNTDCQGNAVCTKGLCRGNRMAG
jgi:hypothetical protein